VRVFVCTCERVCVRAHACERVCVRAHASVCRCSQIVVPPRLIVDNLRRKDVFPPQAETSHNCILVQEWHVTTQREHYYYFKYYTKGTLSLLLLLHTPGLAAGLVSSAASAARVKGTLLLFQLLHAGNTIITTHTHLV
jgi:hypothetical protein